MSRPASPRRPTTRRRWPTALARTTATSRRRSRQFEAARLPVGRRIIERARHLGAYLQATQTAEERARSQRHSIPEAVLAETAVLDFLRE